MRDRSQKRNLPYDRDFFTVDYIMQWMRKQPTCECCGKELDVGFKHDGKPHDDSPSIDRIIPDHGYVQGNIALVCWRCNNLKRDATVEELETLSKWMKCKGCV
jgi:hypothetical protein